MSILAMAIVGGPTIAIAQDSNPSNLTSSPYTRYGFGKLGNVGNAATRSMGDAGIALRTNQYTNLYNPASLTAIDTLTMIFDTALNAEWFSMSENGSREKDWNSGFSYLTMHFPLWNRFAGAIAYSPYSMVGFEYGNVDSISITNPFTKDGKLYDSSIYSGHGGLQHFQLSLAWNPIKRRTAQLNFGLSAGYICGNVDYSGTETSSMGDNTYTVREYSCMGWDLLLGMQYTQQLKPEHSLTFGVTFSPRTHIGCDAEDVKFCGNDSVGERVSQSLSLSSPMKFCFGVGYNMGRGTTFLADYTFENWSKVAGLDANLKKVNGIYQDVHKFSVGFERRPVTYSESFFKNCTYRAGASFKNTYVKAFSNQKEYTATCGIGCPAGRSTFNLSVAYTHLQPEKSSMIKENSICLTLGITFNEMMFYRNKLR